MNRCVEGIGSDEVFFRDASHGFMTWALATVVMAIVVVAAVSISSLAATPEDATVTAQADAARKAAVALATFTGLALTIGAFVGSVAGVIGGRLRDLHP